MPAALATIILIVLFFAAIAIALVPVLTRYAQAADDVERSWRDAFHLEDMVLIGLILATFVGMMMHTYLPTAK